MPVVLCRRLLRLPLLPTPLLRTLATIASPVAPPLQLSSSTTSAASSTFTLDLLTTSCGLTSSQALSAARIVQFDGKTHQQAESVLALLRSHGFSDPQITELVARTPRVLLCRAKEKLAPKLQFLTSVGFSSALIAKQPAFLLRSLDRHIRPTFEFLRRFLKSADDFGAMFLRHTWCLHFSLKTTMMPNVGLLLELGVPAPAISKLMVTRPRFLMSNHVRFAEVVKIVQDWGLKPDKKLFLYAVWAVSGLSKSTLAARLELFKNLGWSEEEVILAFRKVPVCIMTSEQKITRMNIFAGKVGLGTSDLSREPKLLMHSFDKRILPRYAVWQVLTSKGLIEQRTNKLVSMFIASEKRFVNRFVRKYLDKVPELMDVYLGKIKVEALDLDGMENEIVQKK